MSDWRNFEKEMMEMLASELEKLEVPARLYPPHDQVPVYMLAIDMKGLGEKKQDIKLEMCFLPLSEENRSSMNFDYCQFFATIRENISEDREDSILKAANALNLKLAIGSVGIDTGSRTLYLKYCCPYARNMGRETLLTTSDSIIGMIMHELNFYADTIISVADGKLSAEEAMEVFESNGDSREMN